MAAQAMQYASPKAIWNMVFGVTQPSFGQNDGNIATSISLHLSHFVSAF